jgi:hypothetical protein
MKPPLPFTVNDTAPAQIVGGKGKPDLVAGDNADIMLSHFTGKVGQYEVSVLIVQFYPKHGVGKGFPDNPFYLNRFFFCHIYSLQ